MIPFLYHNNLNEQPLHSDESLALQTTSKDHQRTYSGAHSYYFDMCNKPFTSKNVLNVHQCIHGDEWPLSCIVCSKLFRFRSALRRHQRSHSEERPVSCDVCNKPFK
jgi:KRAB domain-containing zinc finger protein